MQNISYEGFNDRRTELYIQTQHMEKAHKVSLHFHRCYEMIYVIDGEMICTCGKESVTAREGNFVFVQKYYSHSYEAKETYNKYVFLFPPNFYADFEKTLGSNTLPVLLDDRKFNRTLLPLIKKLHENFSLMSTLIKKGYVDVIMGELIAHYPLIPVEKNNNIDLLVKILDYIDENYDKPLSLDSISAAFGYNKYYFSKLFNRYIGENMSSYINLVRLQQMMKKAKRKSDVNITELAYECGFDSLSTFYRYFKKVYGINPTEALKENK